MTQSRPRPDQTGKPWLASRPQRGDLSRYLGMLRSHWLMLVGFIAAGLVAAFAYVTVAHKTYTAEADLIVTPVAPDDPNLIGLSLVRETADPTADVLTVSKLVASPSVASLVAKQLGGNPNTLLSHISATPVTQSEIIAVQATASSPTQAVRLADAFANQTVQERSNVMHAQVAALIPTLKASLKGLAAADTGGLTSELAVLETLRTSPDPTLRVSSPASRPASPTSPNRKLSLAAGGVSGLIVGLLMMLAINALDPKLRDEDQLRELFDLPLLVRVPKQRSGRSPLTPRELTPPVAEAFRTLRSAFTVRVGERKRGQRRRGHAILITGDAAADGKTTVALNLAASLTAAGKQVMLIEADLRRPSIGLALRVKSPRGVAEVLLGKVDLVEALVWLRPYGPNLELLLATSEDAREVDRITPESARELVRTARSMCDFVIIDSPPMTDVTDALAFAEEADDVVLVARLGNSHVRKMSDLGELLTRQGILPAGVVLVGSSEHNSYYYYGSAQEQPIFAGLLQRRSRDDRELPAQSVDARVANDREPEDSVAVGVHSATHGVAVGANGAANGANGVAGGMNGAANGTSAPGANGTSAPATNGTSAPGANGGADESEASRTTPTKRRSVRQKKGGSSSTAPDNPVAE